MKEYKEAQQVSNKVLGYSTILVIVLLFMFSCKDLEMVHIENMGKDNRYNFYSKKENAYYSKRDTIGAYELGDKINKEEL